MGFIRAALSAGLNSFNDSKFKEAVVLPDHVSSDVMAIKGQLLTKDPDGGSRQSNQNTGLLTDGSVVIVPAAIAAARKHNLFLNFPFCVFLSSFFFLLIISPYSQLFFVYCT